MIVIDTNVIAYAVVPGDQTEGADPRPFFQHRYPLGGSEGSRMPERR